MEREREGELILRADLCVSERQEGGRRSVYIRERERETDRQTDRDRSRVQKQDLVV